MTALPSNLARVGDDLALALLRDVARTRRRRRLASCLAAVALLALSGSAAVANGWLFGDETPVLRVVPSLGAAAVPGPLAPRSAIAAAKQLARSEGAHRAAGPGRGVPAPLGGVTGGSSRVLLTHLGAADRTLSAVATSSGGVCVALTGFAVQCVATFAPGQEIAWFSAASADGATVVWGLARSDVAAISALAPGDSTAPARIGNGGFYVELRGAPVRRLALRFRDGRQTALAVLPCPLHSPDCTP